MDEGGGGGESFDLRLGKMIAHARGLSEWPIRRSFNFAPNLFLFRVSKTLDQSDSHLSSLAASFSPFIDLFLLFLL
ncbi:hypothetical protein ACE6H2_011447 [Prunus campanulata]